MASPTERPIEDPLLQPDRAPRDARGAPVRAPLGNSGKTLVALIVLALVGAGLWWLRRPPDLTDQLGGREWIITTVDGEPAVNVIGTVSTFVLDGNGEVRSAVACNTATGAWAYEPGPQQLVLTRELVTLAGCPEWPATYQPVSGDVSVSGGSMRIESDEALVESVVESISPVDLATASADEIAGSWLTGASTVDIGRRGLFRVDGCEGEWSPFGDSVAVDDEDEPPGPVLIEFNESEVQRASCTLPAIWADETPVVPVVHDGVLYLRRDRSIFPLDRAIIRLDPADDSAGSP